MSYIAVKDLKKTKLLWEMLQNEREIVVTRDGKPAAVIVGVSPETVDEALSQIRRALFSAAVSRARRRAENEPLDGDELEGAIRESRRERAAR